MNLAEIVRRVLDPLGGDIIEHPARRLRLNLRRVERIAVLAIGTSLMEAAFSFHRGIDGMLTLCILIATGALIFLVLARHDQTHSAPALRLLPEIFITYLLLSSQSIGFFIAQSGRVATGYGLVYLACSAFFLMPPRRFALIGAATLIIFNTWVLALPVDTFDKITNIFNTGMAVFSGMLARWSLDRLEQLDDQQKRQISLQNAALATSNGKLQEQNAELNSLMAIAAHDLRSPLFGLKNLLDFAAQRPPASESGWRQLLVEASGSITAMLALIGRLLEAHEAENEKQRHLERRDLNGILSQTIRRLRVTATRAGIDVRLLSKSDAVQALVDPDALDQIVDNLVSNALRFSQPGSTVTVRSGNDPSPFIEVIDQGIGIATEDRYRLFEKFSRGASPPINGPRGSGLGLYIVKILAASMGAKVSYKPREAGGTVFRIDFTQLLTE